MIAHLIGTKKCPHASSKACKIARIEKSGKAERQSGTEADNEPEEDSGTSKKHKRSVIFKAVKEKTQLTLESKVFRGNDIPFSQVQSKAIEMQFLQAIVSANLPFHWTMDPEIIKLFLMFCSSACSVIPA